VPVGCMQTGMPPPIDSEEFCASLTSTIQPLYERLH